MKVPLNAIALCRCVQIERRWNRCTVSIGSPVATMIRCPNSLMNSRPAVFTGPDDSMAMGTKFCVAGRSAYFVTFREAASSAALPAVAEVKGMYDAAHVWMHVRIVCVYTCVHASMCICMYVYMYACVYTCMYICNFKVGLLAVRGELSLVGGGIIRGNCPIYQS